MALLRKLAFATLWSLALDLSAATPQLQWSSQMAAGQNQTFLLRQILPQPLGGTTVFGTLNNDLTFKQEIRIESLDSNGKVQWIKALPPIPNAINVYLADAGTSSESGFFVLNNVNFPGEGDQTDSLLSKLNAQGDVIWQQQYSGEVQLNNYGIALQADAEGGVVIAGIDTTSVGDAGVTTQCFIRHHDRDGNLLWSKAILGLENCSISSFGPAMIFDPEENLYLALEDAVVKLNREGQEIWRVQGRAFGISLYQDKLYVTSPQKTWAVHADGHILWEVANTGGLYLNASAHGLVSATTEFAESGTETRIRLMSFDLNGNLRWNRRYMTGEKSFARGLHVNSVGEISVFGEVWNKAKRIQSQTAMLGFDSQGKDLWQATVKGSTSGASFYATANGEFYLGDLTGLVTRFVLGTPPSTPTAPTPPVKCPWYNPFCKK